ncbi:hypothetical protein HPB52_025571 [Rhipicephalus sanguineus]|uniref:Uncharacterized protein n=1 Tax=Rhipicephalus sanguineus TaxID=34632 RepID=A0A9D4TCT1_RHISA|nr:hypothetical protein HPB52_025571 [Rhipicephalus sanguineus]
MMDGVAMPASSVEHGFFSATGGGTPPSSEMSDELQRVGDITSHMAVRLPNPCDSDRSRHDAMPGGSQSSNQLCTPSAAALLSQTQDTPLEESGGFGAATLYWLL